MRKIFCFTFLSLCLAGCNKGGALADYKYHQRGIVLSVDRCWVESGFNNMCNVKVQNRTTNRVEWWKLSVNPGPWTSGSAPPAPETMVFKQCWFDGGNACFASARMYLGDYTDTYWQALEKYNAEHRPGTD